MVGNGYRKETKHRMTRRRAGWDYCAPGAYMITLTLAYARDKYGAPLKDRPPEVETAEFRERLDEALAAAEEGAVLVNPCISHGEREIARRAFARRAIGGGGCSRVGGQWNCISKLGRHHKETNQ